MENNDKHLNHITISDKTLELLFNKHKYESYLHDDCIGLFDEILENHPDIAEDDYRLVKIKAFNNAYNELHEQVNDFLFRLNVYDETKCE
jgi:hypothetical protein